MDEKLKILFAEDELKDAELIWRQISKSGITFDKLLVYDSERYLDGLKNFLPDVIISDYSMPQFDGMSALRLRNEHAPLTPFIIVTGSVNEEVAVECLKSGADDYILKNNLTRLGPAIINSVSKYRVLREKKAADESLARANERLTSIFNVAPSGIGLVKNRILLEVNHEVCRMTGYSAEELTGESARILYPDQQEFEYVGTEKYRQIAESEKGSVETRWKKKNGEIINVLLSSTCLKPGDPDRGVIFTALDITERKKAESELKDSYELINSLLHTIPFGMDIVDETGTILFQSENLSRLFEEDMIGRKCWEIYRDDKKQCSDCPLKNGINVGRTDTYESHGVMGNRIFEISHTGMIFKGKKAMLEIFQDITDWKESQEELIKARDKAEESDRLKTAFLHNISHEIRTPLNAIIGFSTLLGEAGLDNQSRKDYVEVIMQSSDHLLAIISDIVDIANIEANLVKVTREETNLNMLVSSVVQQFSVMAGKKKIKLMTEPGIKDSEALVVTDPLKLKQILTNLIQNAIKFTDEGRIKISWSLKGNSMEFVVSDTGIGIPEKEHNRIFERFYKVHNRGDRLYEGTGLGLAISKAHVELMGGKIWVSSEPGKGSEFFFTLPFEKPVKEKPEEDSVKTGEALAFPEKKRILVAEDVDSNFKLIHYFLRDTNAEIIRAENGKEAVEKYRNIKKIDLILMDIKMPIMDGYTAVKLIRETDHSVPIIAQTAYAEDRETAIKSGCSGFISKPFDKNSLLKVIKEFI